jgi:predicted amidohydrolase
VRVAIVQLSSTDDLSANLAHAEKGIQEAAERGAGFVALPENFAYMRREGTRFPCVQEPNGELTRALSGWAQRHRIWLLVGTLPEAIPNDDRVYNTSVLYSPDGEEAARYRKIHLFDVDLGIDGKDQYRESIHFKAGSDVVVAPTPFGGVGLSICYDLRFPELYRAMVDRDARFLVVPSAFTIETGRDHWEVLLRARAIENQAYVLAPAQCGRHSEDRASYGRSLIISPWGLVLAQAGDAPMVLVADCPGDEIDRVRRAVPALTNRQLE